MNGETCVEVAQLATRADTSRPYGDLNFGSGCKIALAL